MNKLAVGIRQLDGASCSITLSEEERVGGGHSYQCNVTTCFAIINKGRVIGHNWNFSSCAHVIGIIVKTLILLCACYFLAIPYPTMLDDLAQRRSQGMIQTIGTFCTSSSLYSDGLYYTFNAVLVILQLQTLGIPSYKIKCEENLSNNSIFFFIARPHYFPNCLEIY